MQKKLVEKKEKFKNKIREKINKKLEIYDSLSPEKKLKVYTNIIKKINILLADDSISDVNKIFYKLMKQELIKKKRVLSESQK